QISRLKIALLDKHFKLLYYHIARNISIKSYGYADYNTSLSEWSYFIIFYQQQFNYNIVFNLTTIIFTASMIINRNKKKRMRLFFKKALSLEKKKKKPKPKTLFYDELNNNGIINVLASSTSYNDESSTLPELTFIFNHTITPSLHFKQTSMNDNIINGTNEALSNITVEYIQQKLDHPKFICIIAIGSVFAFLTTGGNLMVMVSFKIDKQLQTISNYFLFSLAVADIAIGIDFFFFFIFYQ
uniref:G_PROTEIN_RECEP_F1_2 domain-containing protein n=1 Tax=Wuchereria bancrofti TaxID=6293 RepID=A0A1I8EXY3_WUCBA